MMKKLLVAIFVCLIMNIPAMAIEAPEGVTIPWTGGATAYTSKEFNGILEAYGLKLTPEAAQAVPSTYAVAGGDTVSFKNNATAYTPAVYHSILTAYGLQLTPEEVSAKLGSTAYASAAGGTISFGSASTLYSSSEWATILSAYSLPMAVKEMVAADPMPGDSDGDGVNDDKDACAGTPKGVIVDERGCWSHSSKLLFDFDKATIRPEYFDALNKTKAAFDAQADMKVQIDGHTCDMGPESYNQGLSERRAQAVKDYLVNKVGIDVGRLTIKGYGETMPAYPNDSDENRQKNRRVEFTPMM